MKENIDLVIIGIMVILPVASLFFAKWIKKNNKWADENDARNKEANLLIKALVVINILLLVVFGFFLLNELGINGVNIVVAFIQVATFAIKLLLMNFVFILVRWTLPRFRYDQLQNLGWKILLPIAIANIFFTGIFVVVMGV